MIAPSWNLWMGFAFLLHSVLAVLFAWFLAWLGQGLSPVTALIALGLSAIFSVAWYRRQRLDVQQGRSAGPEAVTAWTPLEIALAAFLMFAAWRHFAWLLAPIPGPLGHAWQTLSKNNFGDLALHINYLRAFAEGLPAPFVNPIFASDLLRYPLGADLYSALWEAIGVPTSAHLFIVGVVCTWWAISSLRALGGGLAIVGFFLAGGSLGLGVLIGEPLRDFQTDLEWKNIFLAVWITQRGFLWALPIGVLLWLRLRSAKSRRVLSQSEAVALGILWGGLAIFHLHAFVVVSLLLVGGAVLDEALEYFEAARHGKVSWSWSRLFEGWGLPLIAALPLGTAVVFHSTQGFAKASVMEWAPGWTMPPELGLLQQLKWIGLNFGSSVLVLVIGIILVLRSPRLTTAARRRFAVEMSFFVGLFLLFTAWKMAPWAWDNIKLLLWPWSLGFALLGVALRAVDNDRHEALAWVLALVAGASGLISLGHSLLAPKERAVLMWNTADLAEAEAAVRDLPRDAVFAAATVHNHALAWLGRSRALGYEGHLWSHAISYDAQAEALQKLFMGENPVEQAQRLGATHIFWGPEEKMKWGNWAASWLSKFELVRRVGSVEIYSLRSLRSEVEAEGATAQADESSKAELARAKLSRAPKNGANPKASSKADQPKDAKPRAEKTQSP
ncbi:MAG TPA: hypothetical protein PLZ57_03180 [Pseudobdellovibrionaceae bacterium]|nr:hypothetical protein [Pseudobdellovibrionaceae bacterium]